MSRLGLALAVVSLVVMTTAVWFSVRAPRDRVRPDVVDFPPGVDTIDLVGGSASTAPAWTTSDGGRTWQPWWPEEER